MIKAICLGADQNYIIMCKLCLDFFFIYIMENILNDAVNGAIQLDLVID